MSPSLRIELTPARVESEPGGSAVEATVTLQHRGDDVEQYAIVVEGLDPSWYTAAVTSVGLFPQDKDEVRLTFHPHGGPALRPGSYPFRVVVRSSDDVVEQSVDGVLEVRVRAVFRLDLLPRQQTGRLRGTYDVRVANRGAADVRLALETHDATAACAFSFPLGQAPLVPAGKEATLPLVVAPKHGRWVGPERVYGFSVTARPQEASGEPQTVTGEYVHRPWIAFPDAIHAVDRRAARSLLIALGILLLIAFLTIADVPGRVRGGAEAAAHAFGGALASVVERVPVPGWLRAAPPTPPPGCRLDTRFRGFVPTEAPLLGECAAAVAFDRFGNGLQTTTAGVLFWLKAADSVYFFTGDSVYVLVDGHFQLVRGSGHR